MYKQKIYFPNLNGLRFIAALLVIIHHIEQLKSISKIDNYWGTVPFIGIIGKLGVVLFFVLSGFLITYLLLTEEYSFKKINIGKFYIRRILRIWPLYYLIIILAFLVLPNIDLFVLPNYSKEVIYSNLLPKLVLYAIFFPNLVLSILGVVPYASHTWSIGTEEQFYLVWPVILKLVKKYRIGLMFFIIAFYIAFGTFLQSHYSDFIPYKNVIRAFWSTFNIDCMAIGGLFAILLFQKNKLLKLLQNNILFYLTICVTIFLMVKGIYIPKFHYEFYSVLFGIIILNFASNNTINISLENRALNYLGNISYGLYMYHPIGIILALYICSFINLSNWLIYPFSIILTILMAGLSYQYFESFFLRYKEKFSIVMSGNRKQN
ncbi:MAG: acyltransferase [Bacteroidia bacterium]|nr:acyltransferase [Bacteroidia bacterium]MCO5254571.1 acyltransferase [Bacteroidota bacterium]